VGVFVVRFLVICMIALGALASSVEAVEAVPSAEAVTLSRAARLIKEHKPEAAYALLYPLEEKLAGQKNYDYLLGLAELDSGRAELATIALERVLVVEDGATGTDELERAVGLLKDTQLIGTVLNKAQRGCSHRDDTATLLFCLQNFLRGLGCDILHFFQTCCIRVDSFLCLKIHREASPPSETPEIPIENNSIQAHQSLCLFCSLNRRLNSSI